MSTKPSYENGVWKGVKYSFMENFFQLGERFMKELKENPEIIAQIDGKTGEINTFADIYEKSVRCALWLRSCGVTRNDVVGYSSATYMNSCIPLLATFYTSSIYNIEWNSRLDEELAKYVLESTKPKVLFVDEKSAKIFLKVLDSVDSDVKLVVFGNIPGLDSFTKILEQPTDKEVKTFKCTKIDNADVAAMILYTSGTTNDPKGVVRSYGALASLIPPKEENNYVSMFLHDFYGITSIIQTMHAIFNHTTMIVHDELTLETACQLIEKFKVNKFLIETTRLGQLSELKMENYNMSSINYIFFCGSIAKTEFVEFLFNTFNNSAIITAYGSTECIPILGSVNRDKPTSIGRVGPNYEIKVVDPSTNEVVGPKEKGELYIRGPSLMKGYWNDPQATHEVIDEEGWYHTGDIGYYDEDGDFFIVERIKELIKYRLHHVSPTAIECVIRDHPGVAEVAVVAKPDMEDQEQPTAFIVKKPGFEVTEEEIHEIVNGKLNDRMKLRGGVYFLDKMPDTESGKIAKTKLRAMAIELAGK